MKEKKDNQENQNNESNHPEMNEENVEVSKEVPNTVEDLLERQNNFKFEIIEIDENEDIMSFIEKKQEKIDKTFRDIFEILHKNNSGPLEDKQLALILLKRIKRFYNQFSKKLFNEINTPKEIIEKVMRDSSRIEIVIKMLEQNLND